MPPHHTTPYHTIPHTLHLDTQTHSHAGSLDLFDTDTNLVTSRDALPLFVVVIFS